MRDAESVALRPQRAEEPPKWELVHFPVRCPRCGHDLRGQSQPACPQCSLEFLWHDLIPRDELRCEDCAYSLFGLRELRCPECGRAFSWEGLLRRVEERSLPLHEFASRRRTRAMTRSFRWALRPKKLWNRVRLHHAPRPARLVGYGAVSWLCYALSLAVFVSAALWVEAAGGVGATLSSLSLPALVSVFQQFCTGSGYVMCLASYAIWLVASLGALMVIADSMFRHNVRAVHALRVWAYAAASYPAIGALLLAAGILARDLPMLARFRLPELSYLAAPVIVVVALTARSIRLGYRDYLRIPHARWIAYLTQLIAVLVMMLGQFLLFTDAMLGLFSAVFTWLGRS